MFEVLSNDAECSTGSNGWCCLRFRFDDDELALLAAAESLRGTALAKAGRPDSLRDALALAKAGRKVARATAGSMVSLDEAELRLVSAAIDYAAGEVRWLGDAGEASDRASVERRDAVGKTFPHLVQQGAWRGFGLRRALEALSERLTAALGATSTPTR